MSESGHKITNHLYREQANANPGYLPNLAGALNNLSVRYTEVGRGGDALALAEEAVRLYRELAATNPAFVPKLAGALNNLGASYGKLGRPEDAVTPTEEAVRLYRQQADANPAYLPDLAMALDNLGNRYGEAGNPGLVDAAWEQTVAGAEPTAGAYLLVMRASAADGGDPGSAAWLVGAFRLGGDDQELTAAIHGQARRHRAVNPAGFDSRWTEQTGEPAPAWLTVDARLLATVRAWMATDTYEAERAYLAAHPELLDPAADIAMAEALLEVTEDEAGRYATLRETARREGTDAAYQRYC